MKPTFVYIFVTDTFKQVAKTVMDVNLSDNVVDVVYKMFDENGNKFFINNMTIASVMFYKCCSCFQTLKPRQQLYLL